MKKILLSLSVIAFVGVAVVGATGAFFSDTETSTGNTFTAGAIDLTVDNTSYYNGAFNAETSWLTPSNLDGQLFFDFHDLKPGDWGEDTISLHVNNNNAYACVDVRLDSNNDNGLTEPEEEDGDSSDGAGNGELAGAVNFYWWADDGDNVYEEGEQLLNGGNLGYLQVGQVATVALADSKGGIFDGPLTGGETYYIGKAWCFGDSEFTPYSPWVNDDQSQGKDDSSPEVRKVSCDGAEVDNTTQTDSLTATISFMAVQTRNNDSFVCESHLAASATGVQLDRIDVGDSNSMTSHSALGWFNDPNIGNYGGRDGGETIAMVGGEGTNSCAASESDATFVLNAGVGTANNLIIRHLDGSANDSFDVYVNGVLVGNYVGGQTSGETWVTTSFPLGGQAFTGTATIKLDMTAGYPWSLCTTYGQGGVNWAEITN